MGPMRYDVSIVLELLKIGKRKSAPCRLTLDGSSSELELFVITIMNNKHSGVGLRLSPFAQMDDGKIDVMYTAKAIKSVAKALRLDGMIKSKGKHVNDPLVDYAQASSTIELTCDGEPQRVMVDGDLVGFTPVKMEVVRGAFKLFTPQQSGAC
jgi:diacylglycerol kinase (ATP)